jgi:aerobic-type carbon monoxide dehydrogenase small subunit (CoxS/CutS family)
MTKEEKKKSSRKISRREFIKEAGLLIGGTAVGSPVMLAACSGNGQTTIQTVTKFVCHVDGQEFANLADLQAHFLTEHGGVLAALNVVRFSVNGYKYEMQVEPGWTLQYLLHDVLGWTSIKDMCFGEGACGSCSVMLNGKPVLSCMNLAIECDGAAIETAEGIANADHPLVDAYVMNHCMQCGYCTPGFIVTAKALLDHNPKPTEEDIRDILAGNICRCGTYPQHILAVLEASGQS